MCSISTNFLPVVGIFAVVVVRLTRIAFFVREPVLSKSDSVTYNATAVLLEADATGFARYEAFGHYMAHDPALDPRRRRINRLVLKSPRAVAGPVMRRLHW